MNSVKIDRKLNELKAKHPEQVLIVETPNETVSLKLGETLIYDGLNGEIAIDSE